MAKRPPQGKVMPVDPNLLNAEQKAALQTQAAKQVLDERTEEARSVTYQRLLEDERRKFIPLDQMRFVHIDLAPFSARLIIDNVEYWHGYSYEVPHGLYVVLIEQMHRTWMHQDEIDGRGRLEQMRRPRGLMIGPQHAGARTSDLLRV